MAAIQEGEDHSDKPQEEEPELEEQEGSYRLVVEDDEVEEETPLQGSQYTLEGEVYEFEEYDKYIPEDEDDEGPYVHAIREEMTETPVISSISSRNDEIDPLEYSSAKITVRKSQTSKPRPVKWSSEIQPMVARIQINGLMAISMFDSGSTTDAISPEFTRVSNAKVYALEEQVPIRLGCRGSKSCITYGMDCTVKYGTINEKYYLDIVNVDGYDAIIGVGFMHWFGIKLDPAANLIWVCNKSFPAMSEGEERTEIARRQSVRIGSAKRTVPFSSTEQFVE
jgi:hypothetical protein